MLFLESWAKGLLFIHLVAAVIALAAGIHCLLRLVQLHGRGFPTMSPIRTHARTLAVAYSVCMGLGCLVYPTFRVRVRAEFLDSAHPFVVSLFEMKEHAGLLALPLAVWAWMLVRSVDFRLPTERVWLPSCYVALAYTVAALVYNAGCGWYISSLRSL